jgi:CheY-like chemotaxis protein
VTEDEIALRMLAAEVLAEAGFTVVEAAHADDAPIMKSRAVDVLFTDVQMPGSMDGLELARYVRRHWPRVAVLIASGNKDLLQPRCRTEVDSCISRIVPVGCWPMSENSLLPARRHRCSFTGGLERTTW